VATATTEIAEDAAKGPGGWVIAAISAAMVAMMLGGAIWGAISGNKQAKAEQQEEENNETIQTANENVEAINSHQELSSEILKVADAYEKLTKSGRNAKNEL
jgi:flagellar basal body-associated protein FliL